MNIPHNTVKWELKRNRHTTTDGNSWGWIEGAPGNVCWSNDSGEAFTSADAIKAINEHNIWLEQQRPIDIRINEAQARSAKISEKLAQAEATVESIHRDKAAADVVLEQLVTERDLIA